MSSILITILTVNCAQASCQCTDLTQNFCLVDKSSKYKQFCQTSNKHTYEGYKNCDGQRDGKGTYRWPKGQVYAGNGGQGDEHEQGTKICEKRQGFGLWDLLEHGTCYTVILSCKAIINWTDARQKAIFK